MGFGWRHVAIRLSDAENEAGPVTGSSTRIETSPHTLPPLGEGVGRLLGTSGADGFLEQWGP
jgi:hypothetical protein